MRRAQIGPLRVKAAVAGLTAAVCLAGIGVGLGASGVLSGAGGTQGKPLVKASGVHLVPLGTAPGRPLVKASPAHLVAYADCAQMLREVKAEALNYVGPYGVEAPDEDGYSTGTYQRLGLLAPEVGRIAAAVVPAAASTFAPDSEAAGGVAASPDASGAGTTSQEYSTTNDQEAGVDEPDLVKTDGQVMVVLRQQPLGVQVVDVATNPPALEGFLALPQLAEADGLFLVGRYVVVVGNQGDPMPWRTFAGSGGQVRSSAVGSGPVSAPVPVAVRAPPAPPATLGFLLRPGCPRCPPSPPTPVPGHRGK